MFGFGQRWANRHPGSVDVYTEGRTFLHVDIGPAQVGRVFNPDLGIVSDAGLALDKLLGRRAREDDRWQQGAVLVSSRASYEMVQKSAMCGVEILFAVSAATTLAVDVAERCNLTPVGFCKPGRATIYTHPQRLV